MQSHLRKLYTHGGRSLTLDGYHYRITQTNSLSNNTYFRCTEIGCCNTAILLADQFCSQNCRQTTWNAIFKILLTFWNRIAFNKVNHINIFIRNHQHATSILQLYIASLAKDMRWSEQPPFNQIIASDL